MPKLIRPAILLLLLSSIVFSADVRIGKNMEFIVNGKPFFPLEATGQSVTNLDFHKSLGINVVGDLYDNSKKGDIKHCMDQCASKGLLTEWSVPADKYDMVKQFKDHPALFTWWQPDEPDNNDDKGTKHKPEDIQAIYKKIKAADPNHPIGICFGSGFAGGNPQSPNRFYPEYVKGADFAITDIYPCNRAELGPKKLNVYKKGMSQLAKATKGGMPTGIAVEASFLGAEGGRKTEGTRAPNAYELRAEVWMAIVHGAKYICYFTHSWTPSYDGARVPPDLQAEMKVLNKTITDLTTVILGDESKANVKFEAAKDSNIDVSTMVRETPEQLYIFTSNTKYEKGQADFTVEGAKAVEVDVYGENRKLKMAGGKFSDKYKEFEPHIYVVSK